MKRLGIAALLVGVCATPLAQTQGTFLFDMAAGAGPKHGMGYVLGVHYYVRDGWSLDAYGTLSLGGLAIGVETSYFPQFAGYWVYVDAGMSVLFAGHATVLSLNSDIGWNFARWRGESESGTQTNNAVYGEIGVSRILFNSKDRELDSSGKRDMASGSWWFPNVEIGGRFSEWPQ